MDGDVYVLNLDLDGTGPTLQPTPVVRSVTRPGRLETGRVLARPVPEVGSGDAVARATRFSVRLPIRYRRADQERWHLGVTENLSRTGILFRTELPSHGPALAAGAPLDVVLEVPSPDGTGPDTQVRRRAATVRAVPAPGPELLPALAIRCFDDLWESPADDTTARAVDCETIRRLSGPDILDPANYDDGFAWLVSLPHLDIDVLPGPDVQAEIRRPRRFRVRIPVRYRLPDETDWSYGITDSLSHSGLLIDTDRAAADLTLSASSAPGDDGLAVEVRLEVPGAGRHAPAVIVRCESARMVRASAPTATHRMTAVGIAVRRYTVE